MFGIEGTGTAGAQPGFSSAGPEPRSKTHLPLKFRFSSDFVHLILEMLKSPKKMKKMKNVEELLRAPDSSHLAALVGTISEEVSLPIPIRFFLAVDSAPLEIRFL